MRIAVLATNPDLYSNQRLLEEGARRGHEMVFVRIKQCYLSLSQSKPQLLYRGGVNVNDVDAVIPRLQPSLTFYGSALVRQFEAMSVCSLNTSQSILSSRDKLECLQVLAMNGVPVPYSGFAYSAFEAKCLLQHMGGAPVVIKLLEGTHGKGVLLSETNRDADCIMDAFQNFDSQFLLQEYIKEADGEDIRCYVLGNRVVTAMKRTSAQGDFRSNLHCGGLPEPFKLSEEISLLAIKATQAMGLDVSGVDIMISKSGPKVIEVNSSPGLEGVELVSKENIAAQMIEYLELKYQNHKRGTL